MSVAESRSITVAGKGLVLRFTAIGVRERRRILDAAFIADQIDEYARDWAELAVEDLKNYPPPPPNSKYTRTQDLRDSWRVRRSVAGGNISYVIYNDVTDPRGRKYAGYVQGNYQTSLHAATGWLTVEEAIQRREFKSTVQSIITRGLTRIF